MDIYGLMEQYSVSPQRSERVVAATIDNLNDRRGIKQELQACDEGVIGEIFRTLTKIVDRTV